MQHALSAFTFLQDADHLNVGSQRKSATRLEVTDSPRAPLHILSLFRDVGRLDAFLYFCAFFGQHMNCSSLAFPFCYQSAVIQ